MRCYRTACRKLFGYSLPYLCSNFKLPDRTGGNSKQQISITDETL
jgi:hypothetical protein